MKLEEEQKKLLSEVQESTSKENLNSNDMKVPPPPQISSPSPPPPPRIYAEDLKRGKKRKGSEENEFDAKKDKIEHGMYLFNVIFYMSLN